MYGLVGFVFFWYFVVWLALKLYRSVYNNLIGALIGGGVKWRPTQEDWAIVTGSTDGIGLEYAKQLGAKGYKLLLISRSQEKLEQVKKEILDSVSNCSTIDILAFDFTSTDYKPLETKLGSLSRIDVLVNNVGISYPHPEFYTKMDWQLVENLINVNITSLTKMTHLALKKMEEQRRGIIINLSSLSSVAPMPLLAVYSASKAYVDYFSRALSVEYSDKGIIIQSVLPAFVATSMSKMRPSYMTPTPKAYVKSALKTVGLETSTFGYLPHKLQGNIYQALDVISPCQDLITSMSFKSLSNTRKKAYKKANKKME